MILAVERLTVKRGGRVVIGELALDVAAGEVVGIVGKNGCGKSTLLMAIAGVLEPSDGRVVVTGASVWGASGERRRARKDIGYVPELADPPGFLLASELWALCAAARGAPAPTPDLIERLGLDELRELQLDRMSLGQRRRTCLAAALLGPPQLLVLDEPDNGLDARRLEALETLLRDHAREGRGALVATHDAALLDRLSARIVAL
ncbi:MAG TPA: ABC transporter ATP-binding protein [Kofleriaceae bacterium]|nr:ABC transporter ATP-binding protein [Kofleriaceae bacterium]